MTQKYSNSRKQSGIFRQPREDILNGSASQSMLDHGSLCKVSDFEISKYSKCNLPDLYTVDGLGRATYWLYKHSLADSKHARSCKMKSIDMESKSSAASLHYFCPANVNIMGDTLKSGKSYSNFKNNRNKVKLSKVCDLFSSTSSDIEIKETYNSYVNLSEIDTVDLLLRNTENLSIDKYDNLMMNLELKKLALEKKQMASYRKIYLHNLTQKENRRAALEAYINNLINICRKTRRNKLIGYRNHKNGSKKASVLCKSTETDFLRTGLEVGDLDHILNQIQFFVQSGKFDNSTEEQKSKLEKYLRLLTEEDDRAFIKKQICRRSIHDRLRANIQGDQGNLRNITLTTELKQTSSLIVQTNSSSIRYDTISVHSATPLKKCQACATIDIGNSKECKASSTVDLNTYSRRSLDCSTIDETNNPHSLPVDVSVGHQVAHNYIQTDLIQESLSELEIKSEDLRPQKESNYTLRMNSLGKSTDKLSMDQSYDLLKFHGENYNQRHSKEMEQTPIKKMDKFKSIRSFNESDTFKYLEMKQKQKSVKQNEKHSSEKLSDPNICLTEPDNISNNGKFAEIKNGSNISDIQKKLPPYEGTETGSKPGTSKPKASSSGDRQLNKSFYKMNTDKRRSDNLKDVLGHGKLKKFSNNNASLKLLEHEDEYVCVKDETRISSESDNDSHYKKTLPEVTLPITKTTKNVKSSSFPKPKKVDFYKKNLESDEKQKQSRRPRSIDRKHNSTRKYSQNDEKISLSDNCIEYETLNIQGDSKLTNETQKTTKISTTQPVEKKKTTAENLASDCQVFLNINAIDEGNVTITSYEKNRIALDNNQSVRESIADQDSKAGTKPRSTLESKIQKCRPTTNITTFAECKDIVTTSHSNSTSSCSNHAIRINNSLIHLDENHILKTSESESMESYLKNDVLGRLNTTVLTNQREAECCVNIPIYKKGCEIARLTRPSPSCEYTIRKYVQKTNKSTQMFEHVTRNDLYTLQWIHDNLFEINLNPHTLIIDEKIKEVSEISDVSS